jgi:altronate hydrolase
MINGYLRSDGRKGIRNVVLVSYLVECAHHVARKLIAPFEDQDVHLVGFSGCFPNAYAFNTMKQLCTHPNVGGVILMSLGCEGFDRHSLSQAIRSSGRPAETLVIQETGGTTLSIESGRKLLGQMLTQIASVPRAELRIDELIVGTNCGGSDGTSGLSANPAIGLALDTLVANGGAAMFHETPELIGCEHLLAQRALTPELGKELIATIQKGAAYHRTLGHGSFSPGNADGGLSTMEEKSLGAYSKSGRSKISGILKPGTVPPHGGMYLMDNVPDGEVRFGFPNSSDVSGINEMIASGCHMNLFSTGRGSVVGSAVAPVIKVCANPDTYRRMTEDMDIDAGRILENRGSLDEVGREIYSRILSVAAGERTKSELLGHREFVLTYKSFEPIGPSCLPVTQ